MSKKIKIRLTVKTPLLISSGEKLLGIEYFVKDKYLHILPMEKITNNLFKFKRIISEKEIMKIITNSMKKKQNYDAEGFIKNIINTLLEKANEETKKKAEKYVIEESTTKRLELSETTKRRGVELDFPITDKGEPYIPGSSLKGAIKTALYYYLFKNESAASNQLIKTLNNLIKEKKGQNPKNKRKINFNFDKLIYGTSEFESPLTKFIVRDLKFKAVKMIILDNQREGMRGEKDSKLNMGLYLAPGSTAEGEIIFMDKFLADSRIKENKFLEIIRESYSDFKKAIKQRFKDIEFNDGDLQLGKYGDYFTKSIGVLLAKKASEFGDSPNLKKLRETINFGRSPKGYGKIFPKTITYIMHNNKKIQPGWVSIEIIK